LGLKGAEIPLSARIVAVADVYQALISNRPYRKAYTKRAALKIIRHGSGKYFDPAVVKVFFKVIKKIK
jgi:HD-GYP domain-containing protein (c-di-GMP phosphodiesterase class II)